MLDVRLKRIGRTGGIPLDDAIENVSVLVNDLLESTGSAGSCSAAHQNHVPERIDVICKPAIPGQREEGMVKRAVPPPHALFVAGCRGTLHRVKSRSQRADSGFVDAFDRPPAGGDFEKEPNLEYFIEVMDRRLKNAHSVVAFEPDHPAGAQIDQGLTDWGSGHAHAIGKLANRMETSGQQIARRDRVPQFLHDLLLQAHLLSDRAEAVQTRFGSAARTAADHVFQVGLMVAKRKHVQRSLHSHHDQSAGYVIAVSA